MKETPEQRSRIMRAVKGADTTPELAVRCLAHGMGFRFRLHRKRAAGRAGFEVSKATQGDLRAWLLLARA